MSINIDYCFVIGPVKSGTTLMVSLLDSHQDLSLFPMEVKFITHWLERLSIKQPNYRELSDFFLNESKIKLMNVNSTEESDIMNSGRIDFTGFDYPSLVETMEANASRYDEAEISGSELFRQFMYDIHETLRNLCERHRFKVIVSKEGNHGSKHLEAICDIYPKSKFVVIVRDPRDIYVSFKTIAKKKKEGIRSPSFKDYVTPCKYIYDNKDKNIGAYQEIGINYEGADNYCFVKYENLVEDTRNEMKIVARFLDLSYNDDLLVPTNLGNHWRGNASSLISFEKVDSNRIGKWRDQLEASERRIIEYFCYDYLKINGYDLPSNKPRAHRVLLDICVTEASGVHITHLTSIRGVYFLFRKVNVFVNAIYKCLVDSSLLDRLNRDS